MYPHACAHRNKYTCTQIKLKDILWNPFTKKISIVKYLKSITLENCFGLTCPLCFLGSGIQCFSFEAVRRHCYPWLFPPCDQGTGPYSLLQHVPDFLAIFSTKYCVSLIYVNLAASTDYLQTLLFQLHAISNLLKYAFIYCFLFK